MIDFEQAIQDGMPPSQDMIDDVKLRVENKVNSLLKKIGIYVAIFAVTGAWVYVTFFSVATVGFYNQLKLFATAFLNVSIVAAIVGVATTVLLQVDIKKAGFLRVLIFNVFMVGSSGAITGVVAQFVGIDADWGVTLFLWSYAIGMVVGFLQTSTHFGL